MGGRPRNSTSTPPRAREVTIERGRAIAARLAEAWPDAVVELDFRNPYELLVATILAAQSTDKMINTVTPALFARYPDARALAAADPAELEVMIHSTGFFRAKARNLLGMARAVVERHGGEVPDTMDALCALPGVARKTANVVLGCAFGKNIGFIVDTHITRLSARLGFTEHTDPVKIEQDMMQVFPQDQWTAVANRLIWHGRRVCHAKKPDCDHCTLAPQCPSFPLIPATTAAAGKRAAAEAPAPKAGKRAAASEAKSGANKPAATSARKRTGRTPARARG